MVKKVTKRLKLDLSKIKTQNKKTKVKQEVGEYILSEMDKLLNAARSPVTGGSFKGLKKDYKAIKRKAGGSSSADLFLGGDMRGNISFEHYRDGIEVGVFDESEAQKADNHNKNSAKSKKTPVPLRQFVPYSIKKGRRSSFTPEIRDGIQQILDNYADKDN